MPAPRSAAPQREAETVAHLAGGAGPAAAGASPPARLLVRALTGGLRLRRRGRKYTAAFRIGLMSQLAYAGELGIRTIFLVLIMFIFSSLWHTTYAELGRATLGGFSLTQMLWYLAITESIILSRPGDAFRLDEEVRTGGIAYALARPYNFVLYRYAEMLGDRLLRLAVNLAVALPLAFLFSGGRIGIERGAVPAGLLVVPAALTIDYLLIFTVRLLAFWVEDTTPFQFIYDRLLMILGGMLLPLSLFPAPLAAAARALPFSAVVNGPAQTLIGAGGQDLPALLARQGIALAGAALLAGTVFRLGVCRVNANGG